MERMHNEHVSGRGAKDPTAPTVLTVRPCRRRVFRSTTPIRGLCSEGECTTSTGYNHSKLTCVSAFSVTPYAREVCVDRVPVRPSSERKASRFISEQNPEV